MGTTARTPWHWSKHLKFRPSWLFHTGCFSLHSCQAAISPHVGTSNSTYWALHTPKDWYLQANLHKHLLSSPGAGASHHGAWGAGTNPSQKLLWTHGNQHNGIDPNMLNWGPVFLCTADKLLLCWFFRSDVGWSESERICFDFILLGWYRIWVVVVFCICFLCLGVYV